MAKSANLSLYQTVLAMLKAGNEGKLLAFFQRQLSKSATALKGHDQNIKNLEYNRDRDVETIDGQLEDAEAELNSVYSSIDVERLGNNAQMDAYAEEYWSRITAAEDKVKALKDRRQATIDRAKDAVEAIELQKKVIQERVAKIGELPG